MGSSFVDSWGALAQKSECRVELSSDCSILGSNTSDYRRVKDYSRPVRSIGTIPTGDGNPAEKRNTWIAGPFGSLAGCRGDDFKVLYAAEVSLDAFDTQLTGFLMLPWGGLEWSQFRGER